MVHDKRRHSRLPMESRIFIELVAPDIGSDETGQVAQCRTLDVSRGGLRVTLEHQLVPGAIHQIGVELPGAGDTYYLAGEVRWCQANRPPERGWTAGFALLNAGDSDIDGWTALLARMEN
ncbi:MAG: PilZ domain-containing protein [Pseudomonadales bacterium]|nr:PilZ domain-containing protein [Pseudomonadales bacterium]